MAFSNFLFTFSLTLVAVAVFLTTDVCEPYRESLGQNLSPETRSTMNRLSLKISKTFEDLFGLPPSKSVEKLKASMQPVNIPKHRVFSKVELQQYDGSDDNKDVYLGILGRVFDVTRGRRHYGKGGGYSFFAGKQPRHKIRVANK